MLARTAAQLPYTESSQQLLYLAGIRVDPSQIQRLALCLSADAQERLSKLPNPVDKALSQFYVSVDGTGVPMVPEELEDRQGRGPDGKAKTREVKLAAMFTQTATDPQANPVRDESSTTYLGSFATSNEFGPLVRQAAIHRGISKAATVLFVGDGAAWVWEIARTCFPQAIQILDYFHASQHVAQLAKAVYTDEGTATNKTLRWQALLYESQLDTILQEAGCSTGVEPSEAVERELNYLRTNRSRMDYDHYRKQGWFIGSGVVEAGCKRVIGARLKQSGMFWTEQGAAAIISLRSALLSAGGWDALWSQPMLKAA
jgi:hypothetical protein